MALKLIVILMCILIIYQQQLDADISVNTDRETCEASKEQCSVKLVGSRCPKGIRGAKGDPGFYGTPGFPGLDGLQGAPGLCIDSDFRKPKDFLEYSLRDKTLVTHDNQILCLHYNLDDYRLPERIEQLGLFYGTMIHKFWFSQYTFVPHIFYGLTTEELRYISDSSTIVTQKVRYYCKNSFNQRTNTDDYIRFLSWNNILVGSEPSDFSPTSYVISNTTDGCKDHTSEEVWEYTDIEIKGTASLRLPIVDIQIRDVRKEYQKFHIEPIEICFSKEIL